MLSSLENNLTNQNVPNLFGPTPRSFVALIEHIMYVVDRTGRLLGEILQSMGLGRRPKQIGRSRLLKAYAGKRKSTLKIVWDCFGTFWHARRFY